MDDVRLLEIDHLAVIAIPARNIMQIRLVRRICGGSQRGNGNIAEPPERFDMHAPDVAHADYAGAELFHDALSSR